MHFKALQDAEVDKYQQHIKDMNNAHFQSQMTEFNTKKDSEAARKAYENNRDQVDLNRMNASSLNPSAMMTAGLQFK